jgi:hypothetical protein
MLHGRPPALNINHTDCCFPEDLDLTIKPSGVVEMGCKFISCAKRFMPTPLRVFRACLEVPLLGKLLGNFCATRLQHACSKLFHIARVGPKDTEV